MIPSIDTTDPTFVSDLLNSQNAVWKVAKWLNIQGYNITVRPTAIRPDASQMASYADQGDLEIIQRIEVKQRPDLHFTCRDDFPYPTVIVDVCHTWDKAIVKPYAYIICNAEVTAALIVLGSTRKQWTQVTKYDTKRNRERHFYECPISLTTVAKIDTQR